MTPILNPNILVTPPDRVRPLILSETPIPGESLLGFISRSLANTAITRLTPGLALAGIGTFRPECLPRGLSDAGQITSLAKFLNVDPTEIRSRLYVSNTQMLSPGADITFNAVAIRGTYREIRTRRISPRALVRSSAHQTIWELRPFNFDPNTLEYLLDTCPVCGTRLGWLRVSKPHMCDRCVDEDFRHTTDLRDFLQPLVEVDDVEALTLAHRLISHDPEIRSSAHASVASEWRDHSPSELFESVLGISFAMSDAGPVTQQRVKRPKTTDLSGIDASTLARVSRVILEGGGALDGLIEEVRAERRQRFENCSEIHEFGQISALQRCRSIPFKTGLMFASAVSRSLARTRNRNATRLREAAGRIRVADAAAQFGISRRLLEKMLSSGLVDYKLGEHRGLTRLVEPAQVAGAIAQLKSCVPDETIAGTIGIPERHLGFLEAGGLLHRPNEAIRTLLPRGTSFTRASFEGLGALLLRPLAPNQNSTPLLEVVGEVGTDQIDWVAVVAVVARGDRYGVHPADTGLRIEDWRDNLRVVDVDRFVVDFAAAAAELSPFRTISPAEAAAILGVPVPFVYRAIDRDILEKLPGEGSRLDLESVVRFAAENTFGRRLASHFGVKNTNVLRQELAKSNVHPIVPGKSRDLIYRMAELPARLSDP